MQIDLEMSKDLSEAFFNPRASSVFNPTVSSLFGGPERVRARFLATPSGLRPGRTQPGRTGRENANNQSGDVNGFIRRFLQPADIAPVPRAPGRMGLNYATLARRLGNERGLVRQCGGPSAQ
jgi:hypothetical protein